MKENIEHVNNLNSISKLEKLGFVGTDACLRTSLSEYGLAWLVMDTETLFIYGTGCIVDIGGRHPDMPDFECGNYNRFERMSLDNDLDIREDYDWVDFDAVLNFVGMNDSEWDELPLPYKINDLCSYCGIDEIFGSGYDDGFWIG